MNARDIQKNQKTDKAINKNNAVGINISLGSTGWKDHAETITEETKGSRITAGRTAAVIAKEDMTVKGSTVNAQDIHIQVSWAFLLVSLDCARHEHGTENHPLCGWKINGYTNKKITIRFI